MRDKFTSGQTECRRQLQVLGCVREEVSEVETGTWGIQGQRTSTTAPRYLSGGGNADLLLACACEGLFEGSEVAIVLVVEGEKQESAG